MAVRLGPVELRASSPKSWALGVMAVGICVALGAGVVVGLAALLGERGDDRPQAGITRIDGRLVLVACDGRGIGEAVIEEGALAHEQGVGPVQHNHHRHQVWAHGELSDALRPGDLGQVCSVRARLEAMGRINPVTRATLASLAAGFAVLMVGCSPAPNGYTTTNTVTTITGSRVCLGRLDGRNDAQEVACFDTSDVPGASGLHVGDCVRASRFEESGRVKRVSAVDPTNCNTHSGS